MANPEHVERLKHKRLIIEFVGESSRFCQRMRMAEQQSAENKTETAEVTEP